MGTNPRPTKSSTCVSGRVLCHVQPHRAGWGELAPFPGSAERERTVNTPLSACSRNTARLLQVKTSLFQPFCPFLRWFSSNGSFVSHKFMLSNPKAITQHWHATVMPWGMRMPSQGTINHSHQRPCLTAISLSQKSANAMKITAAQPRCGRSSEGKWFSTDFHEIPAGPRPACVIAFFEVWLINQQQQKTLSCL